MAYGLTTRVVKNVGIFFAYPIEYPTLFYGIYNYGANLENKQCLILLRFGLLWYIVKIIFLELFYVLLALNDYKI